VLGEFEAILSLAAIAHDNPTWCFPKISEKSPKVLHAEGLAHPLQRDAQRVGNDITLGCRETVLFVTGSNMAGKSTLLRSIGTNIVLGQSGGPVCATALEMSPVVLGTVFRVQDSLERGVSLYMTELLRLKEVVEQGRALKDASGQVFLFLLDEILHGTNTAERHIAARSVILELLRRGACGAVSTHDLDLPKEAKLAAVSSNVHFSDRLTSENGAPKLHFDYRLRSGIAQSTNALRLLEIIGLKPDA
jgi:DNA mismatch repair ATPase MutS